MGGEKKLFKVFCCWLATIRMRWRRPSAVFILRVEHTWKILRAKTRNVRWYVEWNVDFRFCCLRILRMLCCISVSFRILCDGCNYEKEWRKRRRGRARKKFHRTIQRVSPSPSPSYFFSRRRKTSCIPHEHAEADYFFLLSLSLFFSRLKVWNRPYLFM